MICARPWWPRGRMVFVRGQVGQDLDTAVNVGVGDAGGAGRAGDAEHRAAAGRSGREARAHLQDHHLSHRSALPRGGLSRRSASWLKGVYPVSTGIVVAGLARPEWLVEVDVIAVIPDEE